MEQAIARENILVKIRVALQRKTVLPFPDQLGSQEVFKVGNEELPLQYEKEFKRLMGKLYYCRDIDEMRLQLMLLATRYGWKDLTIPPDLLSSLTGLDKLPFVNTGPALQADATLTDCECLVARTGTIVLSSAQSAGRALPVFTPVHMVFAFPRQLMPDIRQAITFLKNKYPEGMPSSVVFASGPSRTADIEKTLVVGVHGPREVFLFLLQE